jgi:hypothetical protein
VNQSELSTAIMMDWSMDALVYKNKPVIGRTHHDKTGAKDVQNRSCKINAGDPSSSSRGMHVVIESLPRIVVCRKKIIPQ